MGDKETRRGETRRQGEGRQGDKERGDKTKGDKANLKPETRNQKLFNPFRNSTNQFSISWPATDKALDYTS
jgi:hypothetical protein